MNVINLEEKYILEYIKEMLNEFKRGKSIVTHAKYHHSTDYHVAPSICRVGILSLLDLKKYGIKDYSKEFLQLMDDVESHINGNSAVSLAILGLDDLYPGEDEYNPLSPNKVDFLIDSSLKTSRSSIHYGNEYLFHGNIGTNMLRSIDIRILELIKTLEKNPATNIRDILNLIEKYNYLRHIVVAMKQSQLDTPLREMSYNNESLIDIDRVLSTPKLVLKK